MPHISQCQNADMLYVHCFCDVSATAVVEEYSRRFPMRIIADRRVYPRCSIHCVNVVRFPVVKFHLNGHINNMWRNRKLS
jgi:hypothetical protein